MESKPTYEELEQKVVELERNILQYENTENQYRYLVDSTTDSMYLVDEKFRYIFMNNNRAYSKIEIAHRKNYRTFIR